MRPTSVVGRATEALANLSITSVKGSETKLRMATTMVQCIRLFPSNTSITGHVGSSIAKMAEDEDLAVRLVDTGVVSVLHSALMLHERGYCVSAVCQALSRLSEPRNNVRVLLPVVPAVVATLERNVSDRMVTVFHLAENDDIALRPDFGGPDFGGPDSKGFQVMLATLQRCADDDMIMTSAVRALCSLVRNHPGNRAALIRLQAVEQLREVKSRMQSDTDGIKLQSLIDSLSP